MGKKGIQIVINDPEAQVTINTNEYDSNNQITENRTYDDKTVKALLRKIYDSYMDEMRPGRTNAHLPTNIRRFHKDVKYWFDGFTNGNLTSEQIKKRMVDEFNQNMNLNIPQEDLDQVPDWGKLLTAFHFLFHEGVMEPLAPYDPESVNKQW